MNKMGHIKFTSVHEVPLANNVICDGIAKNEDLVPAQFINSQLGEKNGSGNQPPNERVTYYEDLFVGLAEDLSAGKAYEPKHHIINRTE